MVLHAVWEAAVGVPSLRDAGVARASVGEMLQRTRGIGERLRFVQTCRTKLVMNSGGGGGGGGGRGGVGYGGGRDVGHGACQVCVGFAWEVFLGYVLHIYIACQYCTLCTYM